MSDLPPVLFCANHPNVETSLRCNRCEKPICTSCAILTPTGYRCRECVRNQQKIFDTALWYDYPLAIGPALLIGFIGSQFVRYTGFFTIFLAPIVGLFIAEGCRLIIRKRRSKRLFQLTAAAAIIGSLPPLVVVLINLLAGFGGAGLLFSLLWQGFYTFTIGSTVYYRLGGIKI